VIVEIVFERDCRVFRAGDRFALRPGLNVVVGRQGAGKTTLLGAAGAGADPKFAPLLAGAARLAVDRDTPVLHFDFEKDNARVTGGREALLALGMSHGQYVLTVLKSLADAPAPTAVLLDEPDGNLDLVNAQALVPSLRAHAARGLQVVLTAHSPLVMAAAGEVLSLDHRRWMPAAEYLRAHGAA
jgi:predicted ATPase